MSTVLMAIEIEADVIFGICILFNDIFILSYDFGCVYGA